MLYCFTCFQLATGELPVAFEHFTRRARREQEVAVGFNENADGNFDDLAVGTASSQCLRVDDQRLIQRFAQH